LTSILFALVVLYIIMGVYTNWCVMDVMRCIPNGHIHYNAAQEVISNLQNLFCFSKAILKWPMMVRSVCIIRPGGTNDV